MVTIYYAFVNTLLENKSVTYGDAQLPVEISSRIAAYNSPKERALRIAGKRLLGLLLDDHVPRHSLTLENLAYDEWGKPYFPGNKIKFSMAHSGTLAICALADNSQSIGIDVEEIKPVRLADVEDYLTIQERAHLNQVPDPKSSFYEFWTRKEAILKASGNGVGIPFAQVEVLNNPSILNAQNWHWQAVPLHTDYCIHLATALPEKYQIREITF